MSSLFFAKIFHFCSEKKWIESWFNTRPLPAFGDFRLTAVETNFSVD